MSKSLDEMSNVRYNKKFDRMKILMKEKAP